MSKLVVNDVFARSLVRSLAFTRLRVPATHARHEPLGGTRDWQEDEVRREIT
jgi:hypothetical protein